MSYRIHAAGKKAEIFIYDSIGEDFFGGVSAKQVVDDIKSFGRVDVINVHLNSPGGEVFAGITMFNVLKQHPARIEVDIDGLAASIASIVAMAGDTVRMAKNAMLMIHDPMSFAIGTSEDFRTKAALMDQVKDNMVKTYAEKTGLTSEKIGELMSAETWMQAGDARELGFVDQLTDELDMAAAAEFDLSRFKHPPRLKDGPRANPYRAKIAALAERVPRVSGQ